MKFFAQASLKIKIALLVSGLVLGLTVAVSSVLIRQFEQQLKQNIYQQQFSLVTALAKSIDDKLEMAQKAIVAAAPLYTDHRLDPEAGQSYLDQLPGLRSLFDGGLFLFSAEGVLVAEAPYRPDRRGLNFAFRDYFEKTVASGRPVISDPYLSSREGKPPSIMFTVPVYDQTGNLIAVLGGAIALLGENFLAEIAKTTIGQTGYLYIYNTDRTMIVHSDPARVLQQDVPLGVNPMFDQAIEGFEGTGETITSRGLEVLASFKRLKATNWILAANYPIGEAYASIHQTWALIVRGLLSMALLILAACLLGIHQLLRPLEQLTEQIWRLTRTPETPLRLQTLWRNEISILALAFQDFVAHSVDAREALLEAKTLAEEERAKSAAIIAAISDPLTVHDREFRVLYQNPAAIKFFGAPSGGPTPAPAEPLPAWNDCALSQAFHSGQVCTLERKSTLGGRQVFLEVSASPVRDVHGKVIAGIEIIRDITDRRVAEERLRQSEQLLAEAQRIAHIGSYEWEIPTEQIKWSDETYRIFGIDPDESAVSIETILAAIAPDHRDYYLEDTKKTLETTKVADRVFPILRPDGTKRILHSQGRVFDDGSGQPIRMTGIVQDITERWQAEEQLRVLTTAVQQSPVCIIITDPEARILYVNSYFTELTGYRLREIRGKNPSVLAGGCTSEQVYRELWETLLAKGKWRGEFQNKKKSGEIYWEQALVVPICDGSGTITHFLAIKEDITQRRQTEQRLRLLSQTLEQSPALVMITDTGGTIEYINPKYCQVSGFGPDELFGRNAAELGEMDPATTGQMWDILAAGGEWRGEFRNRKKNGEIFQEAAVISPVKDQQGTTSHFVKVAEDITERRALENQLRHAQKMEAVGQLAAGVAHDFNNLLTAIVGYASIQQYKAEEGSALRSDMSGILSAASRGSKLIQDLLAFSRKGGPAQSAQEFERVDLNQLVTQSSRLLQRLIGDRIKLVVELTADELLIRANALNLEQALLNLAANARDAMPQGGRLCLQVKPTELDQQFVTHQGYGLAGRYAVLSVSDTGSGMDPATLGRIFEPFFTTKEVGKGTGLGLSTTYGIIKQHHGFISCDSELGRGTIFQIFLPLSSHSGAT